VKKYLIAGLLVWLPLAVTIWVLRWLLGSLDGLSSWLLTVLQMVLPAVMFDGIERLRGVPGLGIIGLLIGVMLTGVFATNFVGIWWMRQWDALVQRIPIVKSIYSSVKQVSDTLFSSNGNAFREAVLVQYPRAGSWTIAFVTGRPSVEAAEHLVGEHVSIYVPTTPNPTSGFFLIVPRAELHTLRMSVDEALKYIISMGVVVPPHTLVPASVPASAAAITARN
jgi:uncharacterized membrane protein